PQTHATDVSPTPSLHDALPIFDPAGRPREQIARDWIRTLSAAIRKQDKNHLITVGMLPWDPKWRHLSGFVPQTVAPELDFISVQDRKSTRLNSSHQIISYAVFC